MTIPLPGPDEHYACAGMTGSGKTVASLEMLSMRDMSSQAWIVVDHKRDVNILKLPAENLNVNAMVLPQRGLHLVKADMSQSFRQDLEHLFQRIFRRGNIGIYIDEGHLVGSSEAIRNIMVAGRSKHCPLMWTSQRAHWIDSFIWSQASYYRAFTLQTKLDHKRFEENFPMKYQPPKKWHSYYYVIPENQIYQLAPASDIDVTLGRLDQRLKTAYRAV